MGAPCTCGDPRPHTVMERQTFDGAYLELWHSGELTGRGGYGFPGVPIVRPRDEAARLLALDAGRLAIRESELFYADDVPALYAAARRLAARNPSALPGDLRAAMADHDVPRIPIRWEVIAADNQDRTTVRIGHLPRLRWAGVAVWHERGRYEVMLLKGGHLGQRSWHGTGVTFTSQRDLFAHLAAMPLRTPIARAS